MTAVLALVIFLLTELAKAAARARTRPRTDAAVPHPAAP
jgi:hypothetical protein